MSVATSIEVSLRPGAARRGPVEHRRPRVGVIAGATATGKSAAALAVAAAMPVTIVNADASQVYADLRILSARPDDADLARAPHRLYGTVDGADACSAADWALQARAAIDEAHAAGRLPLLVGGTGLYLRALLDGIAPVPEIAPDIRAAVRGLGAAEAHATLAREDPAAAARLPAGDTQRVARALEVVRSTGRPLAGWHARPRDGLAATHDIVAVVLTRERPALYARCDRRVATMIADGALDETARLLARHLPPDRPVLRAIGVPELARVLAGTTTLADATAAMARATRNYAKRQSTWWRNQQPEWATLDADAQVLELILSEFFTHR